MADKMKTLEDLFQDQLKDLYSAESQIIEALPKMKEKATNSDLKQAFEKHLEETKEQKQRLVQICDQLGIKPGGEKCKAIEGIIKEAEEFIGKDAESEVRDAGLIANAQRVEHYEIAGYGTAHQYATELGHDKIADLLSKTLEEEKDTNEKLNDLAIERVNRKAIHR